MRVNEKNELLKLLWKDEEWMLLNHIHHVLDSARIWGGMEYTYHALPPVKYKPLLESISNRMGLIEKKYGIKNESKD